jgi:hypothetical protein
MRASPLPKQLAEQASAVISITSFLVFHFRTCQWLTFCIVESILYVLADPKPGQCPL